MVYSFQIMSAWCFFGYLVILSLTKVKINRKRSILLRADLNVALDNKPNVEQNWEWLIIFAKLNNRTGTYTRISFDSHKKDGPTARTNANAYGLKMVRKHICDPVQTSVSFAVCLLFGLLFDTTLRSVRSITKLKHTNLSHCFIVYCTKYTI